MQATRRRGAVRRITAPLAVVIAGLLLACAVPGGVAAHAALVTSTPVAGDIVTAVPPEAVLTFSEALQAGSTFAVLDDTGATIATGAPDPADASVMRGALPALRPGVYEVRWTSVAADGDVERDTFWFTVAVPNPPLPTLTASPTDAPTDAPTGAPTESPLATEAPTALPISTQAPTADDGTASTTGANVLLPILALVVVVGAGLAFVVRRRGPA
jgi:methionine-rich copper-binding protein CopC